ASAYNYEQKYAEDAYGEELGAHARFWHVLLDESQTYDTELVHGWRDTLDVLLVFAGLFSAVVTTCVVQSSQALQPDYAQISVTLLAEMIALQRAWASGSSINDVPRSALGLDAVSASALDRWSNGLWYISLTLALSGAFLAVLVKQWILAHASNVSGTPKDQALARQFRLLGIERWNVPLIVGLLPMLMHIALLLFFVGLSLNVLKFDSAIAGITVALTISVYVLYLGTNVLPMLDAQCPYKTPLSHYGYIAIRVLLDKLVGWINCTVPEGLPTPSTSSPRAAQWEEATRRWIHSIVVPLARVLSSSTARTPRAREVMAIAHNETSLQIECLFWVHATSSNPSAINITLQAISGLPGDVADQQRLRRDDLLGEILSCLWAMTIPPDENAASIRERLTRSLLFFKIPSEQKANLTRYKLAAVGVIRRWHMAELQAAVLALPAWDVAAVLSRDQHSVADPVDPWAIPFLHISSPKALCIRPFMWHGLLPLLARAYRSHPAAFHLGIYLWRYAEESESNATSLWHLRGDESLKDYSAHDLRSSFALTIHALICDGDCPESASVSRAVTARISDILPHLLHSGLLRLARAAVRVEALALPPHHQDFHAKVHRREIRFLEKMVLQAYSEGLTINCSRQIVLDVLHLAKASFWSIQSRVEMLNVISINPSRDAAGPILKALTSLLNLGPSDAWHVLTRIHTIASHRPGESLVAMLENDVLGAIWMHLDTLMMKDGEILQTPSLEPFVKFLLPCLDCLVDLPPNESKMPYVEYLTRPADISDPSTTPPNHLTWCILLDILYMAAPAKNSDSADQLHSRILRFAAQTSESHAQVWLDVTVSVITHWRFMKPTVKYAFLAERAQKAFRGLADEVSPGLARAGLAIPGLL
ncbi:hypothetical protein EV122DRAFT_214696, partial [Schizophyllum commune]